MYGAYKAVKSNAGSAGVDGETIGQFEADLRGNLYKIWNRMSSGSYFPPPVRAAVCERINTILLWLASRAWVVRLRGTRPSWVTGFEWHASRTAPTMGYSAIMAYFS